MIYDVILNSLTDLVSETVSCDSKHREKPIQCGYCSSCLLRRQAIEANGLIDQTQYIIKKRQIKSKAKASTHLRAMVYQVNTFRKLLKTADPWSNLCREFTGLADVTDQLYLPDNLTPNGLAQKLMKLYNNYVLEWDRALPNIGQGLLEELELQEAMNAA